MIGSLKIFDDSIADDSMASFYFRAVASDGKLRTGTLTAETDKAGRPGTAPPGPDPGLRRPRSGRRRLRAEAARPSAGAARSDVLFFTQELSTLLNAGVPLDRALSITAELTDRGAFRAAGAGRAAHPQGRQIAGRQPGHAPAHFSELYINMVRAGEASGSLAQIFERLAEFERTRDDLRSYIVSSLIYPALLTLVGLGSIFVLLNFVVPRFALIFSDPRMKIPTPTQMLLDASNIVQDLLAARGDGVLVVAVVALISLHPHRRGPPVVGPLRLQHARAGRRAAQGRNRAVRARHGDAGRRPACRWCNRSASRAGS